jgi:y4mF family transcriptional regulator
MTSLSNLVQVERKRSELTQEQFALRAGVALTVIRKIEQGHENLQLDKVNQVLKMFGHIMGPIRIKTGEPYKSIQS